MSDTEDHTNSTEYVRQPKRVRSEREEAVLTRYAPVRSLEEEHMPEFNPRAKLLVFGFGITPHSMFTGGSLVAFAEKHGLLADCPDIETKAMVAAVRSGSKLEKVCGCNIYVSVPYSREYSLVVGFVRNWSTRSDLPKEQERVNDIVRKLREALGMPRERPMWFYDQHNLNADGVRQLWHDSDSDSE